jgi:hypothetical protein
MLFRVGNEGIERGHGLRKKHLNACLGFTPGYRLAQVKAAAAQSANLDVTGERKSRV